MKKILISFLLFFCLQAKAQNKKVITPDQLYGQLFVDVQLQKILPDGKTFVDCTPKRKVADILYDYGMMKGPGMDLKKFVADNFDLPPAPPAFNYIRQEPEAANHIRNLWGNLKREADKTMEGSSLLPLPYPYIVPGGRFREIYYWDSYFTMLGLKESGEVAMIENMIKNFAFLIQTYGHIPNGNRTYYVSRSQPPFFCLMVDLLAGIKGKAVYKTYLPAMQKEYAYWMEGATTQLKKQSNYKRVVKMKGGEILNRYFDESITPRQESYKEDFEVAGAVANELAMRIKVASPEALKKILDDKKAETYAHLRAGAASGWDFSSRWFMDEKNINSIQTTDFVPVDLNCLMYSMENSIAKGLNASGRKTLANSFLQKAAARKNAIIKYCWNAKAGYFFDYDTYNNHQGTMVTAAGLFPLFVKLASAAQGNAAAATAQKLLLKDGGIVTTNNHTGQQWDAPNGWAPLQWVAVTGVNNYGHSALAKTIIKRWLALNDKVYAATGKMMEKYNVEDLNKEAGGGEYPSQDGFGWSNGVYLAMMKLYSRK
jgi:alpha,alpha-trehalase